MTRNNRGKTSVLRRKTRGQCLLERLEGRMMLSGDGLIATIGSGGKVITDIAGYADSGNAVAVLPDGKFIVAGTTNSPYGTDVAVLRYNPDGSLDPTFGTFGQVVTDLGSGADAGVALTVLPDGRFLVAGQVTSAKPCYLDFAVIRYNADGSLDSTFNNFGYTSTDFAHGYDQAFAMAAQPDGQVVVAGFATVTGSGHTIALARYNTDGYLDGTFGNVGKVTTAFSGLYARPTRS